MSILDRSKHMRDALAATHHPLMCMMEEEIAQGGAETARMEAEKALVTAVKATVITVVGPLVEGMVQGVRGLAAVEERVGE